MADDVYLSFWIILTKGIIAHARIGTWSFIIHTVSICGPFIS